jgi:hypothetical protein
MFLTLDSDPTVENNSFTNLGPFKYFSSKNDPKERHAPMIVNSQ